MPDFTWNPWIGENYAEGGLMVLGESIYDDGDGWVYDKNALINMIYNIAIKEKWQPKLYRNVMELVSNQDVKNESLRQSFWNSIIYLNLVQKLMSNSKQRPSGVEFEEGWMRILNFVKTVKPAFILRLGNSGQGSLGHILNNISKEWEFYPKDFKNKLVTLNLIGEDYSVRILHVNHPTGSWGFQLKFWKEFVRKNIPDICL